MKLRDKTRVPRHPYPELQEVLRTFVAAVQAELVEDLVGIYLVGSLASGDFDLDSDVDFLVVIDADLTPANEKNLQTIQRQVFQMDCYPAKHLEGSYITRCDLNDWDTVGEKELYYFDNGSTTPEWSTHDNQWHVRWILRERGIPLLGPAPETLLPPIPVAELLAEMKGSMHIILRFFEESLDQPLNFFNSQFGQSFVVLTCCRILHTLHTGEVHSKKAGVIWAQQTVDPAWRNFIESAWTDREGVRFGAKIGQRADEELLEKTLKFIQYALAQMDAT
jgi:predicted nucleotidyltransferase